MFGLTVLCLCALFGHSFASAIPMWEYLSKQEKTSFLYSTFANQVENFCESSTLENCNRELLKYGLNKLKSLPEGYLDSMDPYQREASRIIWETMMAGHPLAHTTPKPKTTSTTPKPNSYEDEPFSDLDFGSESAASAKIDNVYRIPAPQNILDQYNIRPQYTYPHNVVSYLNTFNNFGKKGAYSKFQAQYSTSTSTERLPSSNDDEYFYEEVPLTGPMVVKVYPDGTPVKEDLPLPQDEDLRQYQMSKVQIPTFN